MKNDITAHKEAELAKEAKEKALDAEALAIYQAQYENELARTLTIPTRTEKVAKVICRELYAIGQYYRNDWSEFDGRSLQVQLEDLALWIDKATNGETQEEYMGFTKLLAEQAHDC